MKKNNFTIIFIIFLFFILFFIFIKYILCARLVEEKPKLSTTRDFYYIKNKKSVKILELLRNIKKKIKNGEARDLTAVESAIIHIKTGFNKKSSPTTSILFSAIAIRDLGVVASSKQINLNKTDKDIIKNEIVNLSKNIILQTELL